MYMPHLGKGALIDAGLLRLSVTPAVLICLLLLSPLPSNSTRAGSLYHARCRVGGIAVQVISVHLRDRTLQIIPGVALGPPARQQTINAFQARHKPLALVTGVFFDMDSGIPIGDLVIAGKPVCATRGLGTALAVTSRNDAVMLDAKPAKRGWKSYESVLQGGLRLVRGGRQALNPERQGFRDRFMQRRTSRIAVGLRGQWQLLLVKTDDCSLPELVRIMIALGCRDAMALDGGASSAMSYRGTVLAASDRPLSNVLMVKRRPPARIAPPRASVKPTRSLK